MPSRRSRNWSGCTQESAQIIRQARVEAEAIIAESRGDAERLREEMRQKARAEADAIVKNAERQIQLETGRARCSRSAGKPSICRCRSRRRSFSGT